MSSPQVIDLDQMSPKELEQLHEGLASEMEALTSNLGTFKLVFSKYKQSCVAIEDVAKNQDGTQSLIPLTSSMYMSGKIKNVKTVMVDVGTGYFAEKSTEAALEFFKNKMELIAKNIETVEKALVNKRGDLGKIRAALNMKMAVMKGEQQRA